MNEQELTTNDRTHNPDQRGGDTADPLVDAESLPEHPVEIAPHDRLARESNPTTSRGSVDASGSAGTFNA